MRAQGQPNQNQQWTVDALVAIIPFVADVISAGLPPAQPQGFFVITDIYIYIYIYIGVIGSKEG